MNLGGGKAVIIGDDKTQKKPEWMTRFGGVGRPLCDSTIDADNVGKRNGGMGWVC